MATLRLGTWVENKLAEVDGKGKPIHKLEDLLKDDRRKAPEFRSAKALVTRRMAIPESGVW